MKLGIITDIHEDITCLQKAFHIFEMEKCDNIACLGDIVGFCERYHDQVSTRGAGECIRLVRNNCKWVVAGNHDLNAAGKLPEFRGRFQYPGNWFNMTMDDRRKCSRQQVWIYDDEIPILLTGQEIEYIKSLPEYLVISEPEFKILLSHFNYPDITGSEMLFPRTVADVRGHLDFIRQQQCLFGITGHMHTEGLLVSNKKVDHCLSFLFQPYRYMPFGRYTICPDKRTINVPPVISVNGKSGVTIFDTGNMECSVIQIR